MLSTQYKKGLHWILAGDSNELKLESILNLDPKMKQIVKDFTRPKSEKMLDPIIMTLSKYYQRPICFPPLQSDSHNSEADHLMVVAAPITSVNNVPARQKRQVVIRKMPQSGIISMKESLRTYDWSSVYSAKTAHDKYCKIF